MAPYLFAELSKLYNPRAQAVVARPCVECGVWFVPIPATAELPQIHCDTCDECLDILEAEENE